ncbi:ArsC/Spx/MgsR family protein [Klebsiella pneumoniae]|uniref:ArsC/Spx/MgsR family protein n=1 Tax=Klebsiella pneumoniae TaxID=573 RepID=UPI003EE2BBAA
MVYGNAHSTFSWLVEGETQRQRGQRHEQYRQGHDNAAAKIITPTDGDVLLRQLLAAMGIPVRALLRKNVEPYDALGLAEDRFTDDQIIDFMLQHPILINRPIVTTPQGTRLCRPSEVVLEILTAPQQGAFVKEDGEPVIDAAGQRVK